MHKFVVCIVALFSSLVLTAQENMERFVSALMEKMTVEEKIGQLFTSDWHMEADAQDKEKDRKSVV